jgi:hypothetical protein
MSGALPTHFANGSRHPKADMVSCGQKTPGRPLTGSRAQRVDQEVERNVLARGPGRR